MQNFQRMTPDMIKQNLATGQVSAPEKVANRVQFKAQPDIVQNNVVTVDKLQKGYMKAVEGGMVNNLPDYVKGLQSYGMEIEGRKEAQQRLVQHQIKLDKAEKVKNAPRYKNIIGAVAESTAGLGQLGLKGVSNLAEEVAMFAGNDELAQRFDRAEKETLGEVGNVGQNTDSRLYKGTKFVSDVAQVANTAGITSSFDDFAKFLVNNADDVAGKFGLSKLVANRLVKKAGEYVAKSPTASAVAKGAYEGAKDTILYDAVANSEVATPQEVAFGTVVGGGVAGAMTKRANRAKKLVNPIEESEIAGKIVQGDTSSAQKAVKSLQMIDKSGIKTYKDLGVKLSERKTIVSEGMDELLSMSDEIITPQNSITKTTVGNTTVESNFVEKSLQHLDELFTKLGDDFEKARISEIANKFYNGGLNLIETNNLARDYSKNLSAFSTKTGEPLTSIGAKALENTRKGLKSLVRERLGTLGDDAIALDDAYHNLADTSMMVDKMTEKVNALWQKVEKRGLLQKVANSIGKGLDFVSGGLPKEIISSFLLKSNQGLKVMNSIDLENNLAKNLSKLDDILKLAEADGNANRIINEISELVKRSLKDAGAIGATKMDLGEN